MGSKMKRVLAVLTCAAMICGTFPAAAFAALTDDGTQVIAQEEGDEGQDTTSFPTYDPYDYDETSASTVKAYLTVSNDGVPIKGADGTAISYLEVDVPYFDLQNYGLESFYRYGTDGSTDGSYTDQTVVRRPTAMHLFIYAIERYYMGIAESECGKGTSGILSYSVANTVTDIFGNSYSMTGGALAYSGSATSTYMTSFWGHGENLMYYRNHCYPLMREGWGATADYMLLSDGDTIDVAMFSDWNFYTEGKFCCFDKNEYTAQAGSTIEVQECAFGTTMGTGGGFTTCSDLDVAVYDTLWNKVTGATVTAAQDDASKLTVTVPNTDGVYYLLGTDPDAATEESCMAPATAKITVGTPRQNSLPEVVDGAPTEAAVETGNMWSVDASSIFTDADGDTLTYSATVNGDAYDMQGSQLQFTPMVRGTYKIILSASDGYGITSHTITLTASGDSAGYSFYVSKDQNYSSNGNVYPKIELYKNAGFDDDQNDAWGYYMDGETKVWLTGNPHDYTITEGSDGYTITVDTQEKELLGYCPLSFTTEDFLEPQDGTEAENLAKGTLVNNYNMFYAALADGTYTYRAYGWNAETQAYDVYLGGQALILPTDTNVDGGTGGGTDIYLRLLGVNVSSKKVSGAYFGEDDFDIKITMPIMGGYLQHGTAYKSGNYTYYPFMMYAAGNAAIFNVYAYPTGEDSDDYIFSQTINNTVSAGYSATTKSMTINTAVTLKATVPENSDFGIYFQYNNYNTKEIEPVGDAVSNDDGTKTLTYRVSKGNSNYTWRLADGDGVYVTKAGYLASLSGDTEKTFEFGENAATNKKEDSMTGLGTTVINRDEAEIQTYLTDSGYKYSTGTERVRSYRLWQIINSDTANIMIEPDFNVQLLTAEGTGSYTQVDGGNAGGNWVDVSADGTAVYAINYDAIDVYSTSDNAGTHCGLFPASGAARTSVFVLSSTENGTSDAHISYNSDGKESSRGDNWDYNYDNWYYMDTDTNPTLDFTVTDGTTKVEYAAVTTDKATYESTLGEYREITAQDGVYHASLLPFASYDGGTVIIRMTDASGGVSYRLARVAKISVDVQNVSDPGQTPMQGDTVRLTFDGTYRGIYKYSGIFNPTTFYLKFTVDNVDNTEVSATLSQYMQMDRAQVTYRISKDMDVPEDGTTITLTNGYTYNDSMYAAKEPFETLYNMTDTGVGTNFNAVQVNFCVNHYPDISFDVEKRPTHNVKLNITDEGTPVTGTTVVVKDSDGDVVSANESGIYEALGTGEYTFTVACSGYRYVYDSFTLSADDAEDEDGNVVVDVPLEDIAQGGWDGTSTSEPSLTDGVYQISNASELAWFAQKVNGGSLTVKGVLTADIDLSDYNWTPIGGTSTSKAFKGSFDGAGHTIKGFAIYNDEESYKGLFGYTYGTSSSHVQIKDLTLEGRIVSSGNVSNAYIGGVAAYAYYTDLTNVTTDVDISLNSATGDWKYTGGLAGRGFQALFTDCTNLGPVQGYANVGGITGDIATNCKITRGRNEGDVSGTQRVGGVVGNTTSVVSESCNHGNVAGTQYVGGVVGYANGEVSKCYNTGNVTATTTYCGGLAGQANASATLSNCYNAGDISCTDVTYTGSAVGYLNTSKTVTAIYWLEGTGTAGFGTVKSGQTAQAEEKTEAYMSGDDFVTDMNTGLDEGAFKKACPAEAEYPVLSFENGGAQHVAVVSDQLASAASCTSPAAYYVKCNYCNKLSTTWVMYVGQKLPHTFSDTYVYDADNHWHACTVCRQADETAPHEFNSTPSDVIATPATCQKPATYYVKCDVCGAVSTTETVEVGTTTDHDFSGSYVYDDSDTGFHWHVCENCGATDEKKAHAFTQEKASAIQASAATCTDPAKYYAQCDECGYVSSTRTVDVGDALGHDFTGNIDAHDKDGHWHICNRSGCGAKEESQPHRFVNYTYDRNATYTMDGTETAVCTADGCGQIDVRTAEGTKLSDVTAPTGSITVGDNVWKAFVNKVAFNIFTSGKFSVTIAAADSESGLKSVEYLVSATAISEDDIVSATGWKTYAPFSLSDNGDYIVYAKLTDNSGNIAYIGTDGLCVDSIVPQVLGIADGGVYCIQAEFTVTDENLDTVDVGGRQILPYDGKYTISPATGTQTVAVTDKAGNTVTLAVTVNEGHTFENYVSNDDATYLKDGTKTGYCKYCGLEDTITDAGTAKADTALKKFVARLYNVVLDREPDSVGFSNFVNALSTGNMTGTDAAYGFLFSEEFKNRNLCDEHFVEYLYRAILGREADEKGKADWVEALANGQTREAVFNGFAQSNEFKGNCYLAGIDPGTSVAIPQYGTMPTGPCTVDGCGKTDGTIDFVYRMYEVCLGRVPEDNEQSGWVNNLRAHVNTGTECADGFFNSTEYLGSGKTDEQYVDDLYMAYFGREADAPGKEGWLKVLASGESRDSVRSGFSNSTEFDELCKKYGIIA